MRNLIAAVIYRAIIDWENFRAEVQEFFESDYGKQLCGMVDISADEILNRLENNKVDIQLLEEAI